MAEIGNIDILISMLEIVVNKISTTDIEDAEGILDDRYRRHRREVFHGE